MRQRKIIKKDYDVWIYPITFDYDMLLRFKQVSIKHKREKSSYIITLLASILKKKLLVSWIGSIVSQWNITPIIKRRGKKKQKEEILMPGENIMESS